MTRLLSSVLVAGILAVGMSIPASAREAVREPSRTKHIERHGPVCELVKTCVVKKRMFKRNKTVCTTQRVCRDGHGHH